MKIINLLSSPRNVSTALMYSFAQRKDCKVVDEPFYAYYLAKSKVNHPGREEIIASMSSDRVTVQKNIAALARQYPIVFLKNMSHQLIDMPYDFLKDYTNLFLIRNPAQIIASFTKVIPEPTMQDIGVQRQYEQFQFLHEATGAYPLLMDSGEFLKNPASMMARLCEELAIPYDAQMLHWNPGAIPEDGVWAKFWYHNVHKSQGFLAPRAQQATVPTHCEELLSKASIFYNQMITYSLRI